MPRQSQQMPFHNLQENSDIAYFLLTGLAGVTAMQVPDWFEPLNRVLLQADGFYKFGIFVFTTLAIWSRRQYYQKKGKHERQREKDG